MCFPRTQQEHGILTVDSLQRKRMKVTVKISRSHITGSSLNSLDHNFSPQALESTPPRVFARRLSLRRLKEELVAPGWDYRAAVPFRVQRFSMRLPKG